MKSHRCYEVSNTSGSLRSPERGLKCAGSLFDYIRDPSLRSPERGLKSRVLDPSACEIYVAPFAGAWIEILCNKKDIFEIVSLRSPERGLKCRICE